MKTGAFLLSKMTDNVNKGVSMIDAFCQMTMVEAILNTFKRFDDLVRG